MKVYERVVIDIASGEVLEASSYEHSGLVAQAKGPEPAKPAQSAAGTILLKDLRKTLSPAIKQDIISNPFTDETSMLIKGARENIRDAYGARGLSSSGIAIEGELEAIRNLQAQGQAQRAGQLTSLLGTGSGAPNVIPGQQPRGFMGLK